MKKLFIFLLLAVSLSVFAQEQKPKNTYTQTEIDLKLQLQQQEIECLKERLALQNESVKESIDRQEQYVEKMDRDTSLWLMFFGAWITLISIAATVFGYFVNRKTQKNKEEMEAELNAAKKEFKKIINNIVKESQSNLDVIKKNRDASEQLVERINNISFNESSPKQKEELKEEVKVEIEEIEKTKPEDDYSFEDWFLKGWNAGEDKKHEDACFYFKKATDLNPNSHEAYNNWGIALRSLADTKTGKEAETLYKEACDKYKEATDIKEDFHEAYYNWGNALGELANTKTGKEAEDILMQALEKCKKSVEFGGDSYNLACVYALLKDKEKALFYLEESLKRQERTKAEVLEDKDWVFYREDEEFLKLINNY